MVGLLSIAAKEDCVEELGEVVINQISSKRKLCLKELQDRFITKEETIPSINVSQHPLSIYNDLITQ